MPELPELEALRIRMAPRLEARLITAAAVNPKKAHMLRYPVEEFARELPARRITSLTRRGKHLVFATELGGGGSPRWLVINRARRPLWVADGGRWCRDARRHHPGRGRLELRYLDFRDMGGDHWVAEPEEEFPDGAARPEADSVPEMGLEVFQRLRRFPGRAEGPHCETRSSWPAWAVPTRTRSCSRLSCCARAAGVPKPADEEALMPPSPPS
jgi:hypothetical protein